MSLHKVVATENDFLLWDGLKSPTTTPSIQQLTVLCKRHSGIGADGFVYLKPATDNHFEWAFYNADGSSAKMCGNAARAVVHYYLKFHAKDPKERISFKTARGVVIGQEVRNSRILVKLPMQVSAPTETTYSGHKGFMIDSGVPHFVLFATPIREVAMHVRTSPDWPKDGANVTFIENITARHIRSITFERGVNDFTRSCGTGALAAARCIEGGTRPVTVEVPGGTLFVAEEQGLATLEGEAHYIANIGWPIIL